MPEAAVAFVGMMVIMGHILGIATLTSVVDSWPAMKMATAMSFVLASATLHAKRVGNEDAAKTLASVLAFFNLVILISILARVHVSLDDFGDSAYIDNQSAQVATGLPSLSTPICFLSFSLWVFRPSLWLVLLVPINGAVITILCYGFNIDRLIGLYQDWSSGWSILTSISFALLAFTALGFVAKESRSLDSRRMNP